jgi:hypothetical protein
VTALARKAWSGLRIILAWIGALAMVAGLVYCSSDRGRIVDAYDSAWRDSFGTDLTNEVALALALRPNRHSSDIVPVLESNGFMCFQSKIITERSIWNCQRRALRPRLLGSGRSLEHWVLEFECDKALAHCTIINYRATIE